MEKCGKCLFHRRISTIHTNWFAQPNCKSWKSKEGTSQWNLFLAVRHQIKQKNSKSLKKTKTAQVRSHWHHRNTVSSYHGVSKKKRKEGRQNLHGLHALYMACCMVQHLVVISILGWENWTIFMAKCSMMLRINWVLETPQPLWFWASWPGKPGMVMVESVIRGEISCLLGSNWPPFSCYGKTFIFGRV